MTDINLLCQPEQEATVSTLYDGIAQDCSNSSALAMELLQSCIKPSIWWLLNMFQECTTGIKQQSHITMYPVIHIGFVLLYS